METIQWLTVVIAAFVAWIGFLQWLTARQKAVFDLFDKRFKVYETVKHCVDQVVRNPGYFEGEVEKEFLKAVNEAKFLFGEDIDNYLDELRKDIVKVRDASKLQALSGSDRVTILAAMYRINKFSETGEPLFARYIRFTQPVPLVTRIDAWFRRRANQLMMAIVRKYG
jgi:uncharacterized ubiquitin-like protein YukD